MVRLPFILHVRHCVIIALLDCRSQFRFCGETGSVSLMSNERDKIIKNDADRLDGNSVNAASAQRSVSIGGTADSNIINTGDNAKITVHQHFPPAADSSPSDFQIKLYEGQILQLSSELSKEQVGALENLHELFLSGKPRAAQRKLEEFIAQLNKTNFSEDARKLLAAALRLQAVIALAVAGNSPQGRRDAANAARRSFEEAKKNQISAEDATLEARILLFESGPNAALQVVENPATTSAFNFKTAILLEIGKYEQALEIIENPPANVATDAETERLHALALLAAKKLPEALMKIEQSFAARPAHQNTRFNCAVIKFYGALSPVILPNHLEAFPRPVAPIFARQDDESIESLKQAAAEFRSLAEQAEDCESEFVGYLKTWHLACAALLPDNRRRATEECRELLEENPANYQIVSWALLNDFEINLDDSRASLEAKLFDPTANQSLESGDPKELEETLVLIRLYLKQGETEKSWRLTEEKESLFAVLGEDNLRNYWRGLILIARGKSEQVLRDANQMPDKNFRRALTASALQSIAWTSNDWQPFIEYLEADYAAENDFDPLQMLFEVKSHLGDWDYVADLAEKYLQIVQTATAAVFAVTALWNASRSEKCLELLAASEPLFPRRELPAHLRRIKIYSLYRRSRINEALDEAEKLARDDSQPANLILLMEIQLSKGETDAPPVTARMLLSRNDVTAAQFLRAAHLVQLDKPALAAKLWSRARDLGVEEDPNLTAFAITLAARLGLENERSSLMQRMIEYSDQGVAPFSSTNLDELLEMMKESSEKMRTLDEMYAAAQLPLHEKMGRQGQSLAALFWGISEDNKIVEDFNRKFRIFIQHGARTMQPISLAESSKHWNLHCDIASLLLAQKLGVLDKIEKTFKPLKISPQIVGTLAAQREKLAPHQKSQIDECKVIVDLHKKGLLKICAGEVEETVKEEFFKMLIGTEGTPNEADSRADENTENPAQNVTESNREKIRTRFGEERFSMTARAFAEGGFAVALLPLSAYGDTKQEKIELPDRLRSVVVNSRALIDSLKGSERISETVFIDVRRKLGIEGEEHSVSSPLPETKLFLMDGAPDVLAGADILERVCRNFDVLISRETLAEAEATIKYYERLAEIDEKSLNIINRISEGLDDGTYQLIEISDERLAQQRQGSRQALDKNLASTLDLFLFENEERDVIWIDDRALNKYAVRTENGKIAPIITLTVILRTLHERGELDEQEYYELLTELRESNFRYLPLEASEILYHLRSAQIKNGEVVETRSLSVLRRYFASCLLDENFLQLTKKPNDEQFWQSESPFLINFNIAAAEAIAGVWADTKLSADVAAVRALWILDNLYTGHQGMRHLLLRVEQSEGGKSLDNSPVNFAAYDLSDLFLRGIALIGNPLATRDEPQRRNQYFDWLLNNLLASRDVKADEIFGIVAEEIKNRLLFLKYQQPESPEHENLLKMFLGKFFLDLPEVITDKVEMDADFTDWLQIHVGELIVAGGVEFDAREYYAAVEQALSRGGSAPIQSLKCDALYRFARKRAAKAGKKEPAASSSPDVAVFNEQNRQIGVMHNFAFGLLLKSPRLRRQAVESLRDAFDCGDGEFQKLKEEIVKIADPRDRVAKLHASLENSLVHFYQRVKQKFAAGEPLYWRELTPKSLQRLRTYLRLSPSVGKPEGESFKVSWDKAASTLLDEIKLPEALARCADLPVAMPEIVFRRLAQMSERGKLNLFTDLAANWFSPLRRLHLVNLILRLSSGSVEAKNLASSVLNELYREEQSEKIFEDFSAALKFAWGELRSANHESLASPQLTLAACWSHAGALYQIFRENKMRPSKIDWMLSKRVSSTVFNSIFDVSEIWTDCSHPRLFNRQRFLTIAAGAFLAGVDGDVLNEVGFCNFVNAETFLEIGEDMKFPVFPLLLDSTLFRNHLQSFLGEPNFEALAPFVGGENIEILKPENLKETVAHYLKEMSENPAQIGTWGWIHAVVGDLPIYQDLAETCRRALEKFEPAAKYQENEAAPGLLVSFQAAAYQAVYLQDNNLLDQLRTQVKEMVAKILSGSEKAFNAEASKISRILNVGLILSVLPGNPQESCQRSAVLLENLLATNPLLGKFVGNFLSEEVRRLPFESRDEWWLLRLFLQANNKSLTTG